MIFSGKKRIGGTTSGTMMTIGEIVIYILSESTFHERSNHHKNKP
jgi:hypothetical protein